MRTLINKTRKVLGRFFGIVAKPFGRAAKSPVGATKKVVKGAVRFAKMPVAMTKKVVKGAVGLAKKPIEAALQPVKTTKSVARTMRATTRRIGRLVKF